MTTIDLETTSEIDLVVFIETALDRLSMEHLVSVIATAQEKRGEKQSEAKNKLLEQFREQARTAGFSFDAFFPTASRRRSGGGESTVSVKYRGPNGETWSGRGQKANWLRALEQSGQDIEQYRVKEAGSLA